MELSVDVERHLLTVVGHPVRRVQGHQLDSPAESARIALSCDGRGHEHEPERDECGEGEAKASALSWSRWRLPPGRLEGFPECAAGNELDRPPPEGSATLARQARGFVGRPRGRAPLWTSTSSRTLAGRHPHDGVSFTVNGVPKQTDANGVASFDGLPFGTYTSPRRCRQARREPAAPRRPSSGRGSVNPIDPDELLAPDALPSPGSWAAAGGRVDVGLDTARVRGAQPRCDGLDQADIAERLLITPGRTLCRAMPARASCRGVVEPQFRSCPWCGASQR